MKIQVLVLALLLATSIHASPAEKTPRATFGEYVTHSAGTFDFWHKDNYGIFEVTELSDPRLNGTLKSTPIRFEIITAPLPVKLNFRNGWKFSKVPWIKNIQQDEDKLAKEAIEFANKIIKPEQTEYLRDDYINDYYRSFLQIFDEQLTVYGKNDPKKNEEKVTPKTPFVRIKRVA